MAEPAGGGWKGRLRRHVPTRDTIDVANGIAYDSAGDRIFVTMPYGKFTYVVQYQRIVQPTQTSVIDDVGYERLVLSACNPLYSAAQRIIVFARLKAVQPRGPARSQSA